MRIPSTYRSVSRLLQIGGKRSCQSLASQSSFLLSSTNSNNGNHQAWVKSATIPSVRSFSVSAEDLSSVLTRELQEEQSTGNLEMPQELQTLKDTIEKSWRIVDDGAMTVMFSSASSSPKVQLSFHCQDTLQNVNDDIEEEEELDEEDDVAPVKFTVTASKAGKTLVISCLSQYGNAQITGICTSKESVDAIHGAGGVDKINYQGPEFGELAEDLQDSFHEYLVEDCKVNTDVATFVAMYTDYKEQMQYVDFLKDANSIIS